MSAMCLSVGRVDHDPVTDLFVRSINFGRKALRNDVTVGVVLGLVAVLAWSGQMLSARAALQDGLDAWDLLAARFVVAGLIMLPVLLRSGIATLGGVGWGRGAVLALGAGPLFSLLYNTGVQLTPFAHGPIISPSVVTIGSLLLAAVLLKDRPSAGRLFGVGGILAGLAFVASAKAGVPGAGVAGREWIGDLLFVAAGLLWAIYGVALRRWQVQPAAATAAVAVLSMVVVLPGYLAFVGLSKIAAYPGEFAVQALFQGVFAAVVAVFAFSGAIRRLGAGRAGAFPSLVPVFAVLLGVPVLGEVPGWLAVLGIAIATFGLAFAVGLIDPRRWGRRPATSSRVGMAGFTRAA